MDRQRADLVNRVDYPVANAYVTDTAPAAGLRAVPPADPGQATRRLDWRNLAYAAQWWVFALFAVVIWFRAVRDERRETGRMTRDGGRTVARCRRTRHEWCPVSAGTAGGLRSDAKIKAALTRYRVMAYVTGVGLIVLTCIGMPQEYLGLFGGGDSVTRVAASRTAGCT